MKIALLCIVALLQLGTVAARSDSSTSVMADPICPCTEVVASAITKLGNNLTGAQGCSTVNAEASACPGSLGLSSNTAAQSCKEILQCRPSAQSGNYWLKSNVTGAREVYCAMDTTLCNIKGGWMRLVYINMTEPSASCPTSFQQVDTPAKLCGRSATCSGVIYPAEGIRYSQVCGQARGYQFYSTDAFGSSVKNIDSYYVDGVSITHGTPRNHIWTYASGLSDDENYGGGVDNCPCAKYPGRAPPDFVRGNYYCESGITGRWQDNNRIAYDDPLWDGEGCGTDNHCCDQPGMPWFYRKLPQEVLDYIEVRICCNEALTNENVYLDLVEIYVQ